MFVQSKKSSVSPDGKKVRTGSSWEGFTTVTVFPCRPRTGSSVSYTNGRVPSGNLRAPGFPETTSTEWPSPGTARAAVCSARSKVPERWY